MWLLFFVYSYMRTCLFEKYKFANASWYLLRAYPKIHLKLFNLTQIQSKQDERKRELKFVISLKSLFKCYECQGLLSIGNFC